MKPVLLPNGFLILFLPLNFPTLPKTPSCSLSSQLDPQTLQGSTSKEASPGGLVYSDSTASELFSVGLGA